MDVIVRPIRLPTVPERNPRRECGCQPVAFKSSLSVAPLGLFSSSRTFSVLVPWRAPDSFLAGLAVFAPLVPFFAGVALLPDLALADATWRAGFATGSFPGALVPVAVPAWLFSWVSVFVVVIVV